jgi:hypothetical protein
MPLKMLGRTLIFLSLVSLFSIAPANAADIDLEDYWVTTIGQWSRFTFSYPNGFPGFTASLTIERSGDFPGKYRLGNFITPTLLDISGLFLIGMPPNASLCHKRWEDCATSRFSSNHAAEHLER